MKKILTIVFLCFQLLLANDFDKISINEFASKVSLLTSKNIYISEDINSSISLFYSSSLSSKNVFNAFKYSLNDFNLELIKIDDIYYVSKKKQDDKTFFIYKLNYDSFDDCDLFLKSLKVEYSYLSNLGYFVINTSKKSFDFISKQLLDIDLKKKQVMLKIMIFEINDTLAKERGVQFGSEYSVMSNDSQTVLNSIIAPLTGTNTIFNTDSFYSAIRLLDSNAISKVKQFPYILAKDKKSFKFEAVENIPYLESTTTTDSTVTSDSTTVSYKDVGLKISGVSSMYDNYISLDLSLTVEDILSYEDTPTTYKRYLESSTNIEFGKVLLLSGLKRTKVIKNDYSIPFFGSIPYLGELFSYKSTDYEDITISIAIEVINKDLYDINLIDENGFIINKDENISSNIDDNLTL